MRALSNVETARLDGQAFETAAHFDADASKHPLRAWVWLGVFVAGAGFWVAVGLGLHALIQ